MTITYNDQFSKLLLRWPGSLWRSIWKDIVGFLIFYYIINMVYRFALDPDQQHHFEHFIHLFNSYTNQIPLPFLLGFYVAMVIRRWWDQFDLIAWPDHFLFWVSALIKGKTTEARLIRRTIARYCILSSVLAWRSLSERVLLRFPTERHIVNAGLMTEKEYELYKAVKVTKDPHGAWFVPINWIQTIITRCFEQQRLSHTNEMRRLLDELDKYRKCFFNLFLYDWVQIPLVYTQVATISVYGYFTFCLIGRQYPITRGDTKVDLYVPIFTILQFLFYVGWLKVGEDLIFPFGSDDEDFELNYVLDRNFETAYLIVDELHGQMPPLYSDNLLDHVSLPHTKASAALDYHPQVLHLADIDISPLDMNVVESKEKFLAEHKTQILCCTCTGCPCCVPDEDDDPNTPATSNHERPHEGPPDYQIVTNEITEPPPSANKNRVRDSDRKHTTGNGPSLGNSKSPLWSQVHISDEMLDNMTAPILPPSNRAYYSPPSPSEVRRGIRRTQDDFSGLDFIKKNPQDHTTTTTSTPLGIRRQHSQRPSIASSRSSLGSVGSQPHTIPITISPQRKGIGSLTGRGRPGSLRINPRK